MAGALEGVKVLDCTQIIAGPLSASREEGGVLVRCVVTGAEGALA
jgi:hypothetical protein